MGHIDYLRNQFKSMNIFEWRDDYIYIIKFGPVVKEEKTFKFCEINVFS